jgi:hypothetical protein
MHGATDAGRPRGQVVRPLVTWQVRQSGGRRPAPRTTVEVRLPAALDVDADVVRVLVVVPTGRQHYPNHVAATNETYNIRARSRLAVLENKRAFVLDEFVQQHFIDLTEVFVPVNRANAVVVHISPGA